MCYCPASPPPDDMAGGERRSRRDLSPITRRMASDAEPYSHTQSREPLAPGRRSLSATSQLRSKSPPRRTYSPVRTESVEFMGSHQPRHRSATATPQGSPKKRQLPMVPPARERLSQVNM